jgi:gliding motility-associated-like protein
VSANGQTTQTATGLLQGSYSVTVTDANGCTSITSASVSAGQTIVLSASYSDAACGQNNGTATVSAFAGTSPYTYLWDDNNMQDSSVAVNLAAGTYSVTVTDVNGCNNITSVTIVDTANVYAAFTADIITGFNPLVVNFTNLSSGFIDTYSWNFDDSTITDTINPIHTFENEGEYYVTLTVTNAMGCIDTFTVLISVEKSSDLVVPNVFTPNGDGLNDFFVVYAPGMESFVIDIYNRWGQKVTGWTNLEKGFWDGRLPGGTIAPEGTYYYVLSAKGKDGKTSIDGMTGFLTLVR